MTLFDMLERESAMKKSWGEDPTKVSLHRMTEMLMDFGIRVRTDPEGNLFVRLEYLIPALGLTLE